MAGMSRAHVAIVGGGIGGLTAALALRRAGIAATVHERATDLRTAQSGHGLILWHNAVLALRELGVDVSAIGHRIDEYQFRTTSGSLLARWRLRADEWDAPVYSVSRPALHRLLADEDLVLGAPCVGFDDDGDAVTVRFADGRSTRADALVGADGLRSVVRRGLMGFEPPPRYAGYTAWQGVIRASVEPGRFVNAFGRGRWFVHYGLPDGMVYWDAVLDARAGAGRFGAPAKENLLAAFAGAAAPIRDLIEATPESDLAPVDIYDRDPVTRWSKGRVTLLGDAAHPMTFNLGQGAGQAIEDALVLSRCLAAAAPEEAFARYERERIDRTTRMVRRSRANGDFIRRRNPVMCLLRDTFVRVAFESLIYRKTYQLTMDLPWSTDKTEVPR